MATAELKSSLEKFVTFARGLKGDEKGEAQTFLDHFFRALGHGGVIEAGATFEFRVAKKPGSAQLELITGVGRVFPRARGDIRPAGEDTGPTSGRAKGGKKFADLLWPERVLIEMKSRGENLEKHYDQAFDYWTHIVPKRPPYVILCNFDQFWIYDFNTQLFDPVDRISLRDLAENWSAFGFLLPHPREPVFDNNRVAVTRKAADSRNREVMHRFFIGAEMPAHGAPQRWVIDFQKRDLALNLTLATKESSGARKPAKGNPKGQGGGAEQETGEPITPPGLPLPEAERAGFVSGDCIQINEPAVRMP